MNYTELQELIARRLKRNDLSAYIPGYITIFESRINRNLRDRKLETSTNLTTTASVNYISLPSDYSSLKNIQVSGATNTPLTLIPDDTLLAYNSSNYIGIPTHYAIEGDKILLSPIPNAEYTINVVYFQDLPSLTSETTTNWLLTKAPDVYLYGALVEGCLDTQDYELLNLYEPRYKEAVEELWRSSSLESFSGSPLRAVSDYIV